MQRLKSLRIKKKLRQQDLADILGITVSAYGNYELGQREPDIATIIKLAEFFNVSVDYLLGVSDVPYGEKTTYNIELAPEAEDERKMLNLYRQVKQKGGYKTAIKFIELLEVMIKEEI